MRFLISTVWIFLVVFSSSVDAKNCKKGQPCGNSCISWSKTCRINMVPTLRSVSPKNDNGGTVPSIVNGSGDLPADGANISNQEVTINEKARFGCKITWDAIVDVFLFEKDEQLIVDDVVAKIKNQAKKTDRQIDSVLESKIRKSYKSSFNVIKNDKKTIEGLKSNFVTTHSTFMRSCIIETEKILARN